MTWYRIRFDQVEHKDPSPLIVTAPLDRNHHIGLRIPFAGWWGTLKGNAWLRPIIFQPDGTALFARDPEDDRSECIAEMQIFGVALDLGASFYMKDPEDGQVHHFILREKTELDA